MRLENVFLLASYNATIEVVSDFDNLESELSAWCHLKGEKFIQKNPLKHCFSYILKKQSQNAFTPLKTDSTLPIAPDNFGLSGRDSSPQIASSEYNFFLNCKEDIWSDNLTRFYEDSKAAQWNALNAIEWNMIPTYDRSMEFAIAQAMTYLVENEFSALYVPAKFLPKISPYYTEVLLLLSSIIGDEARHIEFY